jgi:hypothetical protein
MKLACKTSREMITWEWNNYAQIEDNTKMDLTEISHENLN